MEAFASSTIERDGRALFLGQARPSKIEESNSWIYALTN